jgi:hypothetical protein
LNSCPKNDFEIKEGCYRLDNQIFKIGDLNVEELTLEFHPINKTEFDQRERNDVVLNRELKLYYATTLQMRYEHESEAKLYHFTLLDKLGGRLNRVVVLVDLENEEMNVTGTAELTIQFNTQTTGKERIIFSQSNPNTSSIFCWMNDIFINEKRIEDHPGMIMLEYENYLS